ncbi:hypothetical protein [Bosea sp. (in: a-proteobacteria)]
MAMLVAEQEPSERDSLAGRTQSGTFQYPDDLYRRHLRFCPFGSEAVSGLVGYEKHRGIHSN